MTKYLSYKGILYQEKKETGTYLKQKGSSYGTKYSRMDQVKFEEDSL